MTDTHTLNRNDPNLLHEWTLAHAKVDKPDLGNKDQSISQKDIDFMFKNTEDDSDTYQEVKVEYIWIS